MNLQESIKRILKEESGIKKTILKRIEKYGLYKTSEIMGLSMTDLIEMTDIPINSEIANELLIENIGKGKIKTKYKEFRIGPSMDGVVYWEAKTNTGHFLPGMREEISAMATPFWDGGHFTPVEINWITLYNEDGEIIYDEGAAGDYFKEIIGKSDFKSIEELFQWYEKFYLPTVYDIIMNNLLPKVHQEIDDYLDDQMGY
jgi:hypothetical protein